MADQAENMSGTSFISTFSQAASTRIHSQWNTYESTLKQFCDSIDPDTHHTHHQRQLPSLPLLSTENGWENNTNNNNNRSTNNKQNVDTNNKGAFVLRKGRARSPPPQKTQRELYTSALSMLHKGGISPPPVPRQPAQIEPLHESYVSFAEGNYNEGNNDANYLNDVKDSQKNGGFLEADNVRTHEGNNDANYLNDVKDSQKNGGFLEADNVRTHLDGLRGSKKNVKSNDSYSSDSESSVESFNYDSLAKLTSNEKDDVIVALQEKNQRLKRKWQRKVGIMEETFVEVQRAAELQQKELAKAMRKLQLSHEREIKLGGGGIANVLE